MATWTKNNTMLFVDFGEGTEDWKRVRKSTTFDLAFNPETEDMDFIDMANTATVLKTYKLTMDQETSLEEGDPLFDEMFEMMQTLPVGDDAKRNIMIVFPKQHSGGTGFVAWKMPVTLTFSNFNTVDKKLSFAMNQNGDFIRGKATVAEDKPTFTAD